MNEAAITPCPDINDHITYDGTMLPITMLVGTCIYISLKLMLILFTNSVYRVEHTWRKDDNNFIKRPILGVEHIALLVEKCYIYTDTYTD